MRLIDADKLNKHKFLTSQVKVIGGRRNGKLKEQFIRVYQEGWNDAIDAIIDNAPTVVNEKLTPERQQGEWIMDNEHTINPLLWYKCNLCGVYHPPTNFCPECGADMRGKKNE